MIPSVTLSNISLLNPLHNLHIYLLKAVITSLKAYNTFTTTVVYRFNDFYVYSSSSLRNDSLYLKFIVLGKSDVVLFLPRTLLLFTLNSSYKPKYPTDIPSLQFHSFFTKYEVRTWHFVKYRIRKD
jgi:hypothetical protein